MWLAWFDREIASGYNTVKKLITTIKNNESINKIKEYSSYRGNITFKVVLRQGINGVEFVIGLYKFNSNKEYEEIEIPDCVSTIYDGAFGGCKANIKIKALGIYYIRRGFQAYDGEQGYLGEELDLSEVDINKLPDIAWLLENCNRLKKVIMPKIKLKKSISIQGLIRGCTKLEEIDLSGIIVDNTSETLTDNKGYNKNDPIFL